MGRRVREGGEGCGRGDKRGNWRRWDVGGDGTLEWRGRWMGGDIGGEGLLEGKGEAAMGSGRVRRERELEEFSPSICWILGWGRQ